MRVPTVTATAGGSSLLGADAGVSAAPARAVAGSDSADQQAGRVLAAGTDPVALAWALWRPPARSPGLDAALNHAVLAAGQVADRRWRTLLLDLASDDLQQDDGVADPQALAVLAADRMHEGTIALLTAQHPRAYAALLAQQCASTTHGLAWLAATEIALGEGASFLAPALLPQCRLELVIQVCDPRRSPGSSAWGSISSGDGVRFLPKDAPGDVLDWLCTDPAVGAIVVASQPQLLVVQRQVVTGARAGFGSTQRPIDDRELIWQELHLLAHQLLPSPARQDIPLCWSGTDAYVQAVTHLRHNEIQAWQRMRDELIALGFLDSHLVVPLNLRVAVVDLRAVTAPPLPPVEGIMVTTTAAVDH